MPAVTGSRPMSTNVLAQETVPCRSLREESWDEACKERWYLSQKAGCDQGEHALRLWVRQHWRGFLRARWIEHMQGSRFWLELDRSEFGLLQRRDLENARGLLDEIIEMIRCGAENLDIVRWARRTKCPADQNTVRELLALVNINAHRLRCFFCDD
jgi:hypothetical protein